MEVQNDFHIAQTIQHVGCNVIKLRINILSHQQILDIFVDEIFIFCIPKKQIDFCLKKEYIKVDVSCV